MPTGSGNKPPSNVTDIRSSYPTKVYKGQPDPYNVGSPSAQPPLDKSSFSLSPPQHPAITPVPGGLTGNTVVSIHRSTEPLSQRYRSYSAMVEDVLPAVPPPDLAFVNNARKDLLQTLRSVGSRTDDHALMELSRARKEYYDAIFAIEQPFVAWREHIFQLIVTSAAFEAGREDEIGANFDGLDDDWKSCSLIAMRNPVDIGLSKQAAVLIATLTSMYDETIPPLRADERERWGELHADALRLAGNMRLDIVRVASHVIEALNPNLISEPVIRLADLAHREAKTLLQPHNDRYNRGTVALALHRILPALRGAENITASTTVAQAYNALIGTDNSAQNESLILSYGNLAQNATNGMIHSARMILKPSVMRLGKIMEDGETNDIRALAQDTQSIIVDRLGKISV